MPQIDFSHFYPYAKLKTFLEATANEFPDLVSISTVGRSHEGRDILLATVTNKATGADIEKPAYWIDANIHAGEVTGSVVALYTIYRYAYEYGKDPRVTALLDDYVIYILPRISVDGAEKYLTSPHALRSSTRRYPYTEDREGLYPEDVDGDGKILQMRIENPNGNWKISEQDSRVMLRREPDERGGKYYHLITEGVINDWDGHQIKMAPPREGLDLNRNFPYDWAPEGQQRGAGDYPFSEPETRTQAEFWAAHRNINGFLTYHTYAGLILRPYSTHPDDHFATHDLDIFKMIGERGTELTGYPCVSVYHGFAYDPKEPMHGAQDDYLFDFYGWFGFTTELWDPIKAAGIELDPLKHIDWARHHPEEDDLKLMRWNDEELEGKGFTPWRPFTHPQLGALEIGGWDLKNYWTNAPAHYLPGICEQHSSFTLAHALMSPRLEFRSRQVEKEAEGIYKITAIVANKGFLPSYTSKRAHERKIVRPISVRLTLPPGAVLRGGKREQEVDQLEGRSNKIWRGFYGSSNLTDNEARLEWIVRASPGLEAEIEVRSDRAGTIRTLIKLE